jgi:predicted N-acyltransferase
MNAEQNSMEWTTEIIEDINQVEPGEWNRLTRNRPFATWRWLQVTEAVLTDHQPRYVLLRCDGSLQAGAVCSIQNRFQSRMLQSTLGWLPYRFPILRCGVPISYDMGVFFSDQQPADLLLSELLHSLQSLLQKERAAFHSFDYLSPEDPVWFSLKARGYHQVEHLTETNLDIHWVTFEEYLSKLAKKKHKEYVRIRGRLEREGIAIKVTDFLTENKTVLQQLVNNVFHHHGEPALYHTDLFSRANALMGEDFKLIVAHQHGECIGCIALLRSGNEWSIKWPGLNYERTLDTGTYYGLLAECIRQTIQAGGRRLRMGATAYQTKQHFGVTVDERIGAMAVRGRPFHWLAGKILSITANPEITQAVPKASDYAETT